MWEVWVQSQVRELGSHTDSQWKNQKVKQKQYVTNSKKTLKNGPYQKNLKKKNCTFYEAHCIYAVLS